MTMYLKFLFISSLAIVSATARDYPRQRILQDQSCYYEPYKKQLTCQCDVNLTKAFLLLRLSYNILDVGQEVRSVQIVSCPDVLLSLDLTQVNPTHIPFSFRNCGVVTMDLIETDPPETARNQLLSFSFNNVETVHFKRVNITQGFKVSSVNVKNLLVTESHIGVLPPDGLVVSNTRKLSIRDSSFYTAYPRSIKVSGVKEVFIINNEFNINVIKVVSAEDGKRLHISCNRLLGEPVSPECISKPESSTPISSYHSIYYSSRAPTTTESANSTESSTLSTTSSSSTESTTTGFLPADLIMDVGLSYEILIGIAAGVCLIFLILLALVVWLCCRTRKSKSEESESVEVGDKTSRDTNENLNTEAPELDKLLNNQQQEDIRSEGEEELDGDDDTSPVPSPRNKFTSPVWIQEIHNNKIFAKQRSINSPEDLGHPLMNGTAVHGNGTAVQNNGTVMNGVGNDATPRRGPVKIPVRSISEILEYETLEDIDADAKKIEDEEKCTKTLATVEENVDKTADVTADMTAEMNGKVVNGSQDGRQLLQTDC